MELSNDLQKALINGFENAKSIEVIYSNGETISGFIKNINLGHPFAITICKHRTPRGENPHQDLDVDLAFKITFIYHDGTTKSFE